MSKLIYNRMSNECFETFKTKFLNTKGPIYSQLYIWSEYHYRLYDFRSMVCKTVEQLQQIQSFCILHNIVYVLESEDKSVISAYNSRDEFLYGLFPGLKDYKEFKLIDYPSD